MCDIIICLALATIKQHPFSSFLAHYQQLQLQHYRLLFLTVIQMSRPWRLETEEERDRRHDSEHILRLIGSNRDENLISLLGATQRPNVFNFQALSQISTSESAQDDGAREETR
jgi:hypothetical protein